MSSGDPKSLLDQLVGGCLTILIAAIALYSAVQVLQAVLPFLVIIVGSATLIVGGVAAVRGWRGRW